MLAPKDLFEMSRKIEAGTFSMADARLLLDFAHFEAFEENIRSAELEALRESLAKAGVTVTGDRFSPTIRLPNPEKR